VALVDGRRYRHQLDRRDAEAQKVRDRRRVREAGARAAQWFRHVGIEPREAAHVQLVDDRIRPRYLWPGRGCGGHRHGDRLERTGRCRCRRAIHCHRAPHIAESKAKGGQALAWILKLRRVESMPMPRPVRSVRTQAKRAPSVTPLTNP
jgi:hypothetical protein